MLYDTLHRAVVALDADDARLPVKLAAGPHDREKMKRGRLPLFLRFVVLLLSSVGLPSLLASRASHAVEPAPAHPPRRPPSEFLCSRFGGMVAGREAARTSEDLLLDAAAAVPRISSTRTSA